MTLRDDLAQIEQALARRLADEDEEHECLECMKQLFPRNGLFGRHDTIGGQSDWRPGLRLTEAWHRWYMEVGAWVDGGQQGPRPGGPEPAMYEPCPTCQGTGQEGVGEVRAALDRVRAKLLGGDEC